MTKARLGATPAHAVEVRSFLRRRRAEILADWRRMAREIPVTRDLSPVSLVDHLPELLDEIASVTEQLLGNGEVGTPDAARRHAVDRLGAGFDISAIVHELSLLRRCILTVWQRDHGHSGEEVVALNAAVDRAVAASVSRYAEARERTLTAIDEISTAALEAPDLDALLRRLLSVFQATTASVDVGGILLLEDDGRLHLRAAVGFDPGPGLSVAIGEGFAGKVAREHRAQELRAAYLDPVVQGDVLGRRDVHALYGVPLVHGNRLIGVAYIGSVTAHELSSDDRHLFDSMAARATIGIYQHILRDELISSEAALQRIASERTRTLAKLESLLSASPVGIAFVDRDLRYVRVNDALARITGRPAAEHVGRSIGDIVPAVAPMLEPIVRRILETGEPVVNLELSSPPGVGAPRSFLATLFPVRAATGVLSGVGGILVEVTELRQAREALRLSEQRLQSILEHAPAAIFVLDEHRRLVIANRQTAAILGRPGEDIIGRQASELMSPELEAEHRATDQRVLRERRPLTSEEVVPSPDGPRTFLSVKFPLPGSSATLVCGIATEITDRKRMEEELRTAIRARDEVLAIVSHDLRNPLGTIQLSATVMLTELATDPRARRHLEMMQRATARMEHLIADLLDTASIQAGKLALDARRESADSILAEIRDLQEPLARERQIELQVRCDHDGVEILCDRERVLQVFGNVIGNALKFCRPGDTVTLTCEPVAGDARFSVADTGPGIAPDLVPHLFEPYWSAPEQARRGTGLGLYIARGIIERHGGRIWVEPPHGPGATFCFTLPLAGAAP
ncbi:MAG TPA: PAS domain-containing protein [Kofleriaceae bacterium]